MVKTESTMLPLGTVAPDFSAPDYNGKVVRRDDAVGPRGLLVVFMCNHCPYVKHVAPELAKIANECISAGIGVVGISSNDPTEYPDDAPDKMKLEAEQRGYHFPYLFDESQEIAKAYRAACTPDFYLFDSNLKLVYRGQMDGSRPKEGSVPDGKDLRAAITALLSGQEIDPHQRPSIGCNIKWKADSAPDYFQIAK